MCWEEEKLLPFMYKLSKCFNTTLKFLNKSRISKTLIGVKVKIDDENEGNKILITLPVLGPLLSPESLIKTSSSRRNQIFCLTISNHFNLYEETFFGNKTASWYQARHLVTNLTSTNILSFVQFWNEDVSKLSPRVVYWI